MKALFLTVGTHAPSARFRVQQFVPHFEANGIECDVVAAYGNRYHRFAAGPLRLVYKAGCRLGRALRTLGSSGYDLVFLQRTSIPYTALPERLAALRNARVIFDFDDAIYLDSRGEPNRWTRRAFAQAVRASARVIAGNRHLAGQTGVPRKTVVIPTVIDTDRYSPAPDPGTDRPLVIGWMGTSSNFGNLSLAIPALRRVLQERVDVVVRLVSDREFPPLAGIPGVEQVRWTVESELRWLRSFDIGLMPLHDTEWNRGKCGFKMIQYMAVGCPVVASAVGANVDIFTGSDAGAMVYRDEDWYPALTTLLMDRQLRRDAGARARAHVERRYSIRSVLPTYLELFREVAAQERRR